MTPNESGTRTRVLNCLLVDDSALTRAMVAHALTAGVGLAVVEAVDGFDAVRRLAEQRFDLVVADLDLPILDGLKLVQRIRRDPVHRDTPILVLTTGAGTDDRDRALAMGVCDYLARPVQAPQLIAAARRLLNIAEGRGNRSAP